MEGPPGAPPQRRSATWIWGIGLVALATVARLAWVLAVPTVPTSDFAMYRESANYLSEFGSLDHGFIYMPGFVALLAWIKDLGGDLLAQKMPGVLLGGLGAAGLYALVVNVEGLAAAVVATALYALWPAGVAMSSVVGTDVPAAALVVAALGALAALGPRRPWAAALAFGVVMGLAAWMRAVALPLAALSAGYWLAVRVPVRRAAALGAVALAAALVVLLPWAIRNARQGGGLRFTDHHGGITALIGANPNSEGTYTRALNQLFRDVAGKGVLDEPHHEVDREAYALAKEWARFEPAYALGLAAKKAERLFEPERRLLYWSVFRPGVLVGAKAAWFDARREAIGGAVDEYGEWVVGLGLLGIGVAAARRRWALLALLPFMLALAATYTIFFAEPRYRVPVEMLAFPFVALALVEAARLARAAARRDWRAARAGAIALGAVGGALVVAWRVGWPALVVDGGADLRARHRWAVTVWNVGGHARTVMWRPAGARPARSPLEGAPSGVWLRAGAGAGPASAELKLGEALGGGPLPAGTYALHVDVEAAAGGAARVELAGAVVDVAPGATAPLDAVVHHAGGSLQLAARVTGAAWLSKGSIRGAED